MKPCTSIESINYRIRTREFQMLVEDFIQSQTPTILVRNEKNTEKLTLIFVCTCLKFSNRPEILVL